MPLASALPQKMEVVTLTGHVENFFEKSAAEKAARRVNDVKAVAEEIEVRLPSNVKRGDEEIASRGGQSAELEPDGSKRRP